MEVSTIDEWKTIYAELGQGRSYLSACYAPYYLELLSSYLRLEPTMLAIFHEGELLGLLPLFVKVGPAGNVANSLPYYGSYGGCLISPSLNKQKRRVVKAQLLSGLLDWAMEEDVSLLTIINHPFEEDIDLYISEIRPDFHDERIGQVLPLPQIGDPEEALERLMLKAHQKTRNMIRKGLQLTEVRVENNIEAFRFLHEVHRDNMEALGGHPKEWGFFQLVQERLMPVKEYMLYVGYVDNQHVAASLTLRYGGVIEYFTPVIRQEFRPTQALSAVIMHALQDGAVSGYRWWNWGGTWLNQKGVYSFKARWGGEDRHYLYHIKVLRNLKGFIEMGKDGLLKGYPFFYTIPFRCLATEGLGQDN